MLPTSYLQYCLSKSYVVEYLGIDIEEDDDTDEDEHPPQVDVDEIKCLLNDEQLAAFQDAISPFCARFKTEVEYIPLIDSAIECCL